MEQNKIIFPSLLSAQIGSFAKLVCKYVPNISYYFPNIESERYFPFQWFLRVRVPGDMTIK